eukprot:CAMPEP_0184684602 /NCGR_PEP_ID=MMETSP0312-20130426/15903_1 /TAXON_ID=31354 /ORGANISM="Compsopogon coeruleus, Strain SAG 36.94" /LENGTH=1737 /DNA_ID=CAMNT_0027137941 /DNA_START=95 /DNA_END=5308 /DNA_ORIENTATION=+
MASSGGGTGSATATPVSLSELFSLTAIGVSAQALTFNALTLESDRHISIREMTATGQSQLVVVDTADPNNPLRKPITADSAAMNPVNKIIALRAANQIQLFDFATKQKVKSFAMPENVVFWKWVSEKTIGLVTPTAVYHWRTDDAAEPRKVFDRHASLTNAQIINYRADAREEWLCLVGIAANEGGGVTGSIQLYSVTKRMSQAIEGHAASFVEFKIEGHMTTLFVFASKTKTNSKLHIIEVGQDRKSEDAPRFEKQASDIYYPPEIGDDFPVAIQVSSKYSIVYLITRQGYLHLYDIESATALYMNRISDVSVFASAPRSSTGGLLGVNRRGQVLAVEINTQAVVPYVMQKLRDVELATRLASRNGFPGAEKLFFDQFQELFREGQYREAALVAAESPAGCLRTPETIQMFRSVAVPEGQPSALLVYFQALLERATLNKLESLELGYQVVSLNRAHLLEKWLKEDKMECSEELGDLVRQTNVNLGLAVYIKAKAHEKVIQCLIETGQTQKVAAYAQKVGMTVDATKLVQMASSYSPQAALELANSMQGQMALATRAMQPEVDHDAMYEMFIQRGMIQEATSYCLDNLKDDNPKWGKLQTKVLEANLVNAPQVADAILQQDIWHQYDKQKIAMLCERAGLFQHALENFKDLSDVKRVMQNTHVLNPDFIVSYFGTLAPDDALECLKELIKQNPKGNLQLSVTVAAKYTDHLGATKLMNIFSSLKIQNALYLYLGAVVSFSDDPEVHFKFIEAACNLGMFDDAERVTRESNFYDPERVKVFLMSIKPRDPRPLINVCDRFGFVDEMIRFMIKNGQMKFVEGYVQRVNPLRCSTVVGTLLDLDQDEEFIKKLILSVKNNVKVGDLVTECEKRGRLKLLLQFLESCVADGSTDVDVHSGVAKVYIETNINPEHFLDSNPYYDSRVVGAFCEKRDPFLAFVAYKRGRCDNELLDVTNKNQLYKDQARYLVDRESPELWEKVLDPENPNRKLVLDQVISVALPETKAPEKVSATVKAFMAADLPELLMELLEKLVLQTSNSVFSRNRNLQNLLVLTAAKTDKGRVMEYVRRLDNYDATDIAEILIGAEMFEEAFTIFQKFEKYDLAVGVLVENLQDFKRAEEYAIKVDKAEVWSRLGSTLCESGRIVDGINALMKAKDHSHALLVIKCAGEHGSEKDYESVVKYLKFARSKVKDIKKVDTEIVYALCRTHRLGEVEEFIALPHAADLDDVGERCFDEELWPASKLLFTATSNYAKLAIVLVRLDEFQPAVDAARRADRVPTWKAVCFACVDKREFRLAQICALHLVVESSELMNVIDYYQDRGFFMELIEVMDQGLSLDRAHQAMFTENGILYSKYRERNMMEYVKMWWQRCNIPRLIRACENARQWAEVTYLHIQYNEYDNAALVMMQHSPDAWSPSGFTDVLTKAGNLEVMYKAIQFYVDEQPELLSDLLLVLAPKCESTRVISILQRAYQDEFGPLGLLPLAKGYLHKVQEANVPEVNSAVNEVYLAEENIDALKESIESFDNFDQFDFARILATHERIELRRIGIELYRKNGKYEHAIEAAKKEKLWRDCVESAASSKDSELAESLAEYFLKNKLREGFTATLFNCFEFFKPDVALELAWLYEVMDFTMPFMIQTLKEVGQRLIGLEQESKDRREAEEETRKEMEAEVNDDPSVLLYGLGPTSGANQPLLLTGAAGMHGGPVAGGPAMIGWHGGHGSVPVPPSTYSVAQNNTFSVPPS